MPNSFEQRNKELVAQLRNDCIRAASASAGNKLAGHPDAFSLAREYNLPTQSEFIRWPHRHRRVMTIAELIANYHSPITSSSRQQGNIPTESYRARIAQMFRLASEATRNYKVLRPVSSALRTMANILRPYKIYD